jgi:drug/metabolite transporter (DMT)-like permease
LITETFSIVSFIIGEHTLFQINQVTARSVLSLLYLIIFGSVIAFSAYVLLLGHTSVTRTSTYTYVNPIIAVILGWLIASEEITTALLIATIVIIISVYLVLYDQYRVGRDE